MKWTHGCKWRSGPKAAGVKQEGMMNEDGEEQGEY